MKKKLGPLEVWQWGVIVLTAALAYYLYKKHQASAAAAANVPTPPADTTNTPGTDTSSGPGSASTTDPNLIDQSTGQPLLSEINADISALQSGLQNLAATEQNDAAAIENALGSLPSQLSPVAQQTVNPGASNNQNDGSAGVAPLVVNNYVKIPNLSQVMGHGSQKPTAQQRAQQVANREAKAVTEAAAKVGASVAAGFKRNPGHIVTITPKGSTAATHHVGSKSISKTVAPAQHQIAPTAPTSFIPNPIATVAAVSPHPAAPSYPVLPPIIAPVLTPNPTYHAPPPPPPRLGANPPHHPAATHNSVRIF